MQCATAFSATRSHDFDINTVHLHTCSQNCALPCSPHQSTRFVSWSEISNWFAIYRSRAVLFRILVALALFAAYHIPWLSAISISSHDCSVTLLVQRKLGGLCQLDVVMKKVRSLKSAGRIGLFHPCKTDISISDCLMKSKTRQHGPYRC